MQMQEHNLSQIVIGYEHATGKTTFGYECQTCKWRFAETPRELCPGVPRYKENDRSFFLSTREELRQQGLEPRSLQHPDGVFYTQGNIWWLYRTGSAIKAEE